MLILGIESAGTQVGCAVGGHEGVLASAHSGRGRRHAEALAKDPAGVSPEVLAGISADFVTLLDFSLGPGALRRIEAAAWSVEIEQTSKSLIFSALSRFIIADKALLPSPPRSLTVIRRLQ